MSYLIKNNTLIATTTETLKSGDEVQVAWQTVEDSINAARDENLVNATWVKVSNAKKWKDVYCENIAIAINDSNDEFKLV